MKRWGILLLGFLTVNAWACGVCEVRHPAAGAFAARVGAPRIRALQAKTRAAIASTVESQLDVVDVLLAYDRRAVNWLASQGKGSVQTFSEGQINKMNEYLANSLLLDYFHFRLAGVVTLDVDLSTGGLGENLDRFINENGHVVATGELAKVAKKREEVGADIVSIFVANGKNGTIGTGYSLEAYTGMPDFDRDSSLIPLFGDWAYNICSIEAENDGSTLLHEIGHNMGAGHPDAGCANPADFPGAVWTGTHWQEVAGSELGPQLYPYSSAYYFWKEGVGYYTIMAYNYGGLGPNGEANDDYRFEPAPFFSSPELTWKGCVLGTAVNDNRRTLINTYRGVAQYRVSKLPKEGSDGPGEFEGVEDPESIVTGAFHPLKALNGVAPYVGTVRDSSGKVLGSVSLKVGKENKGKLVSKVSGQIVMLDGSKYSIKAVDIPVGDVPQSKTGITVSKLGTLELTMGESGFHGVLSTSAGEWIVKTDVVGGSISKSQLKFALSEFSPPAVAGFDCLEAALPIGEIITVSGTKWSMRAVPSLKYKKIQGMNPAAYELLGIGDAARPNASGLKLSYTAKSGIFKGSFKLYYTNEAITPVGKAPKMKKLTMNVNGLVVGTEGVGRAICKKPSASGVVALRPAVP
ncbi:MAG: M12 family metallo-peptidase [Kiritimatiellae bacterium]|nr:M12 family metallo-peptidase [Kiritimatiellia bacterium]